MRIQNNITALNTHRQYTINNDNVAKSAEKLSSGYRINRAGDDAAGLAISEKMRSQIRGLNMATKNSQDAISLVQTAEGALQETQNMLQRMNELAVQAATGTNQEIDRTALAKEFEQLKREINDVAEQTTFNNMKVLDGSMSYEGFVRSAQTSGINWQKSENVTAGSTEAGKVYGATVTGASVDMTKLANATPAAGNDLQLEMKYTDKDGQEKSVIFKASQATGGTDTADTLIAQLEGPKGWSVEVSATGAITATATEDFNIDESKAVSFNLTMTGTGNTGAAADLAVTGTGKAQNTTLNPADAATKASLSIDLSKWTPSATTAGASGDESVILQIKDGSNVIAEIKSASVTGGAAATAAAFGTATLTSGGNDWEIEISGNTINLKAKEAGATEFKNLTVALTGTGNFAAANTQGTMANDALAVTNGKAEQTGGVGDSDAVDEGTKAEMGLTLTGDLSQTASTTDDLKLTITPAAGGDAIELNFGKGTGTETIEDLLKANKTVTGSDGNEYTIKYTADAAGADNGGKLEITGPAADKLFLGSPADYTAALTDGTTTPTVAVDSVTAGKAAPAKEEAAKYTHTMEFDPVKMKDGDTFHITVGGTTVDVQFDSKLHYTSKGTSAAERFAQSVEKAFKDAGMTGVEASGNALIFKTNDEKATMNATIEQKPEEWKKEDGSNPNAIRIQVGALQDEQLAISIDSMNTAGLGLDDHNLNTQNEAGMAITAVRAAINKVSDQRASLGAMQNRLDHKIANLKVSSENLSAAESRIRDVDMASEMTNFTKNNILSQAATAMLAQANALPQNVLSLLG